MGNTLYLIDGHAQIYRAYFAVMGLTSPTGEPTNATFGFCNMLLKLFQARQPTHVVLALDAGAAARLELDATYKAQRKPMPEDMPVQIERIEQIVATLGIPIVRSEGCEADDVIATIVHQVRKMPRDGQDQSAKIYMCSKDKDLDQLIDEQVWLYDIQTDEELDAAGLRAKKGYGPEQVADVLALTGDTVDNIAGIPGVGPKTAAKWITQYGSLDGLIAHAEEIKGKAGETLRANLPVLERSRKLVRLIRDVPVSLDWDAARVKPERLSALAPLFRELGFSRMLALLEQVVGVNRGAIAAAGAATVAPATRQADTEPIPGGLFGGGAAAQGHPAAQDAPATDAPHDRPSPVVTGGMLQHVVGDYRLVHSRATLDAMIGTLRAQLQAAADAGRGAWLAVDTETDSLGAMSSNLCGISLSALEGTGYYVAVKGAGGEVADGQMVRALLGPLLGDEAIAKVGQNLKYDINSLRVFGIDLGGVWLDTMVASYVLDSSRLSHGMDALAADWLGLQPIPIRDLIGKGAGQISFADVPVERACGYSAEDADVTLRLARVMHPKLVRDGLEKLCLDVEMPLVKVLADMEYAGVGIDAALLTAMSKDLGDKLVDLSKRIHEAAGVEFNHDSPKQLAQVLFTQLKLPVIKKTKTGPSTDIEVLEELADKHPVPALIVEYRQLSKLKSTYLDALVRQVNPRTGRVHASFNQTVAATGRLSSSDPNLQNIPMRTDVGRQIRRAFVAAPGHVLVSADYSQIELRMLAHYCADPALVTAFQNGRDVHRVVAAEIFGVKEEEVTSEQRGIAKTVNFGIIYGQTGFGLSRVLKIPQEQANDFIAAYKKRFPQIERFTQECVKQASLYGFVTTILGRRRLIPDINSPLQARRQFGQRAAMNSVIQGSAADLIKLAMVNLSKKLAGRSKEQAARSQNDGAKLIMQIHDELVLECRAEQAEDVAGLVRREMEGAMALKVPLKVDVAWGKNWFEGK